MSYYRAPRPVLWETVEVSSRPRRLLKPLALHHLKAAENRPPSRSPENTSKSRSSRRQGRSLSPRYPRQRAASHRAEGSLFDRSKSGIRRCCGCPVPGRVPSVPRGPGSLQTVRCKAGMRWPGPIRPEPFPARTARCTAAHGGVAGPQGVSSGAGNAPKYSGQASIPNARSAARDAPSGSGRPCSSRYLWASYSTTCLPLQE